MLNISEDEHWQFYQTSVLLYTYKCLFTETKLKTSKISLTSWWNGMHLSHVSKHTGSRKGRDVGRVSKLLDKTGSQNQTLTNSPLVSPKKVHFFTRIPLQRSAWFLRDEVVRKEVFIVRNLQEVSGVLANNFSTLATTVPYSILSGFKVIRNCKKW